MKVTILNLLSRTSLIQSVSYQVDVRLLDTDGSRQSRWYKLRIRYFDVSKYGRICWLLLFIYLYKSVAWKAGKDDWSSLYPFLIPLCHTENMVFQQLSQQHRQVWTNSAAALSKHLRISHSLKVKYLCHILFLVDREMHLKMLCVFSFLVNLLDLLKEDQDTFRNEGGSHNKKNKMKVLEFIS